MLVIALNLPASSLTVPADSSHVLLFFSFHIGVLLSSVFITSIRINYSLPDPVLNQSFEQFL
jgi:hypothetical protein